MRRGWGEAGLTTGLVGLAQLVADAVSVGVLVTTPDDRILWANQALRDLAWVDGDPGPLTDLSSLPTRGARSRGQERGIAWTRPDGTQRWLDITGRQLTLGSADQDLLLYEISDVTAAHERQEQGNRLFQVEERARAGTWEWDLATEAVEWSEELLALFGYPPSTELDYYDYRSLLYPEDVALIETTLAEALRTTEPFSYTHRMYLADRVTLRVFECYGEVLTDASGRPLRVLGAARDVTEQHRVQAELVYLAEHDPLTSLPNRRSITKHLRERLDGGASSGALLFVDIDNFKIINDSHGHLVGDHVLRALAPLLLKRSDPSALLGRLGGDEFAILLPDGDIDEVLTVAESLCDVVAGHPFVAAGIAVRVTVSIGVAPLQPDRDSEVVLADADHALHEAKWAGGNRAQRFCPEQQLQTERVSVFRRVHDALDAELMDLDAQPIVDLATGDVAGYELLLRLRDGIEPRLGPAQFLPSVERNDLVGRLDRWVVDRAVEALSATASSDLRLDVNISGRSLDDPSFGDYVVDRLRRASMEPARLGIEITEAAAITSLDAARRLAERLTHAGCRFTLDDFGAGFGSFVYLKHLPCTAVKISGELVRQVDRTATDTVIIESVVRAARGFGMRTIAEHVDREPLISTLRSLGVDRAQGLQLGRPRPLTELLR